MNFFQWLGKLVDNVISWIGELIRSLMESIVSILENNWDDFIEKLEGNFDSVQNLLIMFQIVGSWMSAVVWNPNYPNDSYIEGLTPVSNNEHKDQAKKINQELADNAYTFS